MDPKFQKAELPVSCIVARQMAAEREEWAKEARERDQYGSAREFELTALLLKYWAEANTSDDEILGTAVGRHP